MSFCFFRKSTGRSANTAEVPLVFIPGWGFDARIVRVYDLFPGRELLVPKGFVHPASACRDLLSFIDENCIKHVHIVGWSMGANIGLEFTSENSNRVSSLGLLSMRREWPQKDVDDIRQGILDDLPGFMKDFYRKCFLGYRKQYREFGSRLQEGYLNDLDIGTLLDGLGYLEKFILPSMPANVEIHAVHGGKDIIAPAGERYTAPGVKETLVPKAGHGILFDYVAK